MSNEPHIALIGEMGVGKTTVGAALAEALGRPFLDSDEVIETSTGRLGAEIAADMGVGSLHSLEMDALRAMVGSPDPAVIAPAASVVDSPEGRALLKRCTTVLLEATESVLETRREHGGHRRVTTVEERAVLRLRREPYLASLAVLRVDTSVGEPSDLVDLLLQRLRAQGDLG